MEKEGERSSDPQKDKGRKQGTCTHTSQHCSCSLEIFCFGLFLTTATQYNTDMKDAQCVTASL